MWYNSKPTLSPSPEKENDMSYKEAQKKYAALGVDTEKAIKALQRLSLIHI